MPGVPRYRPTRTVSEGDSILSWEASAAQDEPYDYYRLWLAALENVLAGLCAVSREEVNTRARTLARRPAGHDHRDRPDHHEHHDHPH
ncbi:hypothetical protein ACWEQN_41770 [Streptomyces sp. NPDC004129]